MEVVEIMDAMSEEVRDAMKAQADVRAHLKALAAKVTEAVSQGDEARKERNAAILEALVILSVREISEIEGMPNESYVRYLMKEAANDKE